MAVIKQNDLIESIADALQFISYYHPMDFIKSMYKAYLNEKSKVAKNAIAQILINSRMCAIGHRPICQDTGIVTVFIEIGIDVTWDCVTMSIDEMINEGVRIAYTLQENILRASIVQDPVGFRKNTKDNTPAVIHYTVVPGENIKVYIAAKGGGSENKAKLEMLNPSDSVYEWVLNTVKTLGAGWCPPGILGIGIGGTAEKAAILAKKSLFSPININEIKNKRIKNSIESLRVELFDKINNLGIGAQGVGGLTTVLDVKILDYPTHAASMPVCIIPNCAANRHIKFILNGSGPAIFKAPKLDDYPKINLIKNMYSAKKIQLDTLIPENIQTWKLGETLLISGKLITGRDVVHQYIINMLNKKEKLPISLKGRFMYYVGPVNPIKNEVVGPAGPTTANRMDKFTRQIIEQTGLLGMIGKAERGNIAIQAIKDNKAVYLIAIGGAAYLVAQAIKQAKVIAFAELGMEAMYEFLVEDMPVTVAVNSNGESIHITGPEKWKK